MESTVPVRGGRNKRTTGNHKRKELPTLLEKKVQTSKNIYVRKNTQQNQKNLCGESIVPSSPASLKRKNYCCARQIVSSSTVYCGNRGEGGGGGGGAVGGGGDMMFSKFWCEGKMFSCCDALLLKNDSAAKVYFLETPMSLKI